MFTTRCRVLFAATLLAAGAALFAAPAGTAGAAPVPSPMPTPPAASPTPTAPSELGSPGDLRVTAVTPNSITLSWTASTGGCCPVQAYLINYNQAFDDQLWYQSVGNVTTTTITSNIVANGQYMFSVSARDTQDHYSSPAYLTVVTPAATSGDTTPPAAPTNLRITGLTPDGPTLAWSPSTDNVGVTAYRVYFYDGWYTSTQVGITAGTAATVPYMSSYQRQRSYYVRAQDAAGNLSIASATVPSPTPPTSPGPGRTCRAAYRTTTEWAGGFVAEVTATNTGTVTLGDWAISFPTGGDQRVTSAWNATLVQNQSEVTLGDAGWNRTLQPGGSVTVGLVGNWTLSDAPPARISLNGVSCALG